jgi:prolyl 4-hydroxylase
VIHASAATFLMPNRTASAERARARPPGHPLCGRRLTLKLRQMPNTPPPSDLELAEAHDAAGRHDEAINALALGTRSGNLPCMRQLGKRLLAGDRAPLLAAEGARFVLDAAQRGDAEAAARIAALTGLGLYIKPSWPDALRWLVIAAERGWPLAQGQLLALAEADASAAAANDWSRLASRLEPTPWQTSPPSRELSSDAQIQALDSFISPAVCDWIIGRARGRLTRALVYNAVNQEDYVSSTRTNSVANISLADIELLDVLLQVKMSHACRIPMSHMEAPAVLHYAVGEEASNHYDFVNPDTPDYAAEIARNGQRILTFLIYLNEDYEGGETNFPTLGVSHKGRRGGALFFANAHADLMPDMRMLHAGRTPARGEKWIVSQFIRSREVLTARPARTSGY